MTCPHCGEKANIIKKGSFARKTGADRRVDRFFCRSCRRHFSANTHAPMSRQRRPELEMMVFALLISGVSQRRTARLLSTTQTTVARKLVRLGAAAAVHGRQKLLLRPNTDIDRRERRSRRHLLPPSPIFLPPTGGAEV